MYDSSTNNACEALHRCLNTIIEGKLRKPSSIAKSLYKLVVMKREQKVLLDERRRCPEDNQYVQIKVQKAFIEVKSTYIYSFLA